MYIRRRLVYPIFALNKMHYNLFEGIHKQMNQIPVRFFVEKLKDQWEIVLTGIASCVYKQCK